jgi:putative acetyltransferase
MPDRPRRRPASGEAMTTIVRAATSADRDAILAVVRDAFSKDGGDGREEVDIVTATWSLGRLPAGIELVATRDDALVGHVLAAFGALGDRPVLGVAPLSVAPTRQGQGIGSALMTEVLSRAEEARCPLVVVLGDPAYYGRFGFEPAGPLGIEYRPVGADNPAFQVRRLASYDPSCRGAFTYCWESSPA